MLPPDQLARLRLDVLLILNNIIFHLSKVLRLPAFRQCLLNYWQVIAMGGLR